MIETSTRAMPKVHSNEMHYSYNLLSVLYNGIDNCKVATLEYDSYGKGISVRDIEPMAIVYKDGRRTLVAWCRLRNDFRSFLLDRMNCIKITNEEFSRREDFRIEDFQDVPRGVYENHYQEQH